MNAEQFAYWLQGFVEIHGGTPDEGQWYMIKEHLQQVFKKETKNKEQVKDWLEKIKQPTEKPVDAIGPTFPNTNPDPNYWQYPHRPYWSFQPTITC